jgi:hypothetical protein
MQISLNLRRRLGSVAGAAAILAAGTLTLAQGGGRPMSPDGYAQAHVLGEWKKPARQAFTLGGEAYEGGQWIDIEYGRPLKRGRDLFGSGENYGKAALVGGQPVWRAGANVATRLKTSVPLVIGGKTVPAGEYTIFIDLKPANWTLIVSSWPAQLKYDANDKTALWGAYNYTPDKDVVRTPMTLARLPFSVEQLTWSFVDMAKDGGRMAIMWGNDMASVPFTVAAR